MTTQNLSSVAIHVVGQYNDAGKTLVGAYRAGVHRLLGGAASRYSDFLAKQQLPLVNEDVKAKLLGAQEKVNGFLANRLDVDTSRVVSLMDRVATASTTGIESIASRAAQIESPVATSLLNAFNALHMPLATVSAQIADKVAEGAKQIEVRVSGSVEDAKVVRETKAKPRTAARRPARKA